MANDSEVQINWTRQISKLMEDQTRIMDELVRIRKDVAKGDPRYDDLCAGIRQISAHLTASNGGPTIPDAKGMSSSPTSRFQASTIDWGSSIPCAQGPPQYAPGQAYGQTRYDTVDMSFTMRPPPEFETPQMVVPPTATSTEKRPQDCKQDPTSDAAPKSGPLGSTAPIHQQYTATTQEPSAAQQPMYSQRIPVYPGVPPVQAPQQTAVFPGQNGPYTQPRFAPTQQPTQRPTRLPHWNATFSGDVNENLDAFISQFEHYALAYGLVDAEAAALFVSSLRGRAANISSHIAPGTPYGQIIKLVRQRYAPVSASTWLAGDFSKQIRKKDESPRDFLERLSNLAVQAFPTYNKNTLDERLLEQFLNGQDPRIRMILAGSDVTTLEAAVKRIMQIEDAMHASGAQEAGAYSPYGFSKKARAVSEETVTPPRTPPSVDEDEDSQFAFAPLNIRWINHALEVVTLDDQGQFAEADVMLVLQATAQNAQKDRSKGACFFCSRKGHSWRKCYQLKKVLIQNGMKGDGPFPKDTPEFLARNSQPQQESK